MKRNMISMSSSLVDARLSHSLPRIRFSRGMQMFTVQIEVDDVLAWFGLAAASAVILIVAIAV